MLAIYNAPIALETGGKSVARIEQRADGLRAQVRPLRLALGSVLSAWHRNILQFRHEKVSIASAVCESRAGILVMRKDRLRAQAQGDDRRHAETLAAERAAVDAGHRLALAPGRDLVR